MPVREEAEARMRHSVPGSSFPPGLQAASGQDRCRPAPRRRRMPVREESRSKDAAFGAGFRLPARPASGARSGPLPRRAPSAAHAGSRRGPEHDAASGAGFQLPARPASGVRSGPLPRRAPSVAHAGSRREPKQGCGIRCQVPSCPAGRGWPENAVVGPILQGAARWPLRSAGPRAPDRYLKVISYSPASKVSISTYFISSVSSKT